ncbi:host attachment family protein [Maricaulis sp. CAU 1757]
MNPTIDAVTWVVALDGGKLLRWKNEGFDDHPNLKLLEERDPDTPPDRELAADKPGRMHDDGSGRSSMDETNFHDQEKNRFIRSAIEGLNEAAERKEFDRLVLLAPPTVLGEARQHYSDQLSELLVEHGKDVVNQPVSEIEKRVKDALGTR